MKNLIDSFFNLFTSSKVYSVLIDSDTRAVLAVGEHYNLLYFLSEWMLDTDVIATPSKNIFNSRFYNKLSKSEEPYLFRWEYGSKKIILNTNLTEEVKNKSTIARAKYRILQEVSQYVFDMRLAAFKGLFLQDYIYSLKREEANKFVSDGYPENEFYKYPFVNQYAKFAGVSLKESAESILFKVTSSSAILSKSELFRMKYFKRIKEASSVEQLESIKKDMFSEMNVRI